MCVIYIYFPVYSRIFNKSLLSENIKFETNYIIEDNLPQQSSFAYATIRNEFISPYTIPLIILYPSFLSFSCVLSRFCLVFGFCRFLNNPFTLFLRYSVEVQWNNDVNTYVDFFTLTTSCEAPPPLFLNNLRLLVKPPTIPQ